MTIEFIDRHNMLPPGTKVLAALSGGKDSVYLLRRLLDLAPERDLTVQAAHLNHQLRGAESDRDEQFVRDLCASWNVPLNIGAADVPAYAAQHGMGVEEAARALRYAFLESVRQDAGCDVIATAHQAEDQTETMLLNLARGAGARGLVGIPTVRGHIIRPILNISQEEILRDLSARGIAYVEDSSNRDDRFSRNRLRHQALPALASVNPRFAVHAAAAAETLREDDAYLQAQADAFLRAHYRDASLPAAELAALPRPIGTRVLRALCGPALDRAHTEQLLRLCAQTQRRSIDIPGQTVHYDQGRLWFGPDGGAPIIPTPLTPPGGSCLAGDYRISWEMPQCGDEIHNSFNTFDLNREKINGTVYVTEKRDGDRIRLAGRNCTKTLKALFQERKLTQRQRRTQPVLRDDAGVLAVPGFGIAERCLPEPGAAVIRVSWKEYKEIGG